MTVDVGHDIEDDTRRGALSANLGRERHDAIGLAAHQSARSGVVEGKGRNGDLIEPPETHLALATNTVFVANGIDDEIP